MLKPVLTHLGLSVKLSDAVMDKCLRYARDYPQDKYEKNARQVLVKSGILESGSGASALEKALINRSLEISLQITPYLVPGSVCDYGCGDGQVGQDLNHNGYDVVLADVYTHPDVELFGLPFHLLSQGGKAPFKDNTFDNTLALTVYHHCDDPILALEETVRITRPGGRIVAIESVFGVKRSDNPVIWTKENPSLSAYLALTSEQQRMVNIFFDHLYNRVLHYSEKPDGKVNVPFNFNTPSFWKEQFERLGCSVEIIPLGIDQPAVPEYHMLLVATKLPK